MKARQKQNVKTHESQFLVVAVSFASSQSPHNLFRKCREMVKAAKCKQANNNNNNKNYRQSKFGPKLMCSVKNWAQNVY